MTPGRGRRRAVEPGVVPNTHEGGKPDTSVVASKVYELDPNPKVAAAQLIVLCGGAIMAARWLSLATKALATEYRP